MLNVEPRAPGARWIALSLSAAILLAGCQASGGPGATSAPAADKPAAATSPAAAPVAKPAASPAAAGGGKPGAAEPQLSAEQQQQAEAFYKGKVLRIIVGSPPGGGFDTTARLVSRHIGNHIPGKPEVIVENMPGGSNMVAANYIYTQAPKDGTVIGTFHENNLLSQVTGTEGVQFDMRKFAWLGSSYSDPNVCVIRANAPVKTFEESIKGNATVAFGGTGPGAATYEAPRVVAEATGAKIKAVGGYPGTNDARLGIERGELQGMCLGWESVKTSLTQWLNDGMAKVFVQNGARKHKDLADVPLALDYANGEEGKALLRLLAAPNEMSKPYAAPPEVDPSRLAVLRSALAATYSDPAFLAEARNLKLDFSPSGPPEMQEIIDAVLATPAETVKKYKEIVSS